MAKATLHLDNRHPLKNGKYPLVIRISHLSKYRMIPLKVFLLEEQWNSKSNEIKKTAHSKRDTIFVQRKLSMANSYLLENENKFAKLDVGVLKEKVEYILFKSEEDPEEFKAPSAYLKVFGKLIADRFLASGKYKTSVWYNDAISSIIKFNNGNDIYLSEIDVTFIENYKASCLKNKQSRNSISARLRALRAIMNKAQKEGNSYLSIDHKPFRNVAIPSQKTAKRAVSKEIINKIRTAEIQPGTLFWHDRNYFLFMFNMQGMNFIDLAKLKCEQIANGRLRYVRSKTNKEFDIKITKEAQEILSNYLIDKLPDQYVFPILPQTENLDPTFISKTSEQALHVFNLHIQKLAKNLGIEEKITSYVIRHSWASAARKMGITTDIIGDGLGHSNYTTTEIYLQSFEHDVIDDANEKVTGV